MRAYRLSRFGEEPELAEIGAGEPGPGQVRLRIAAAGLNFADLLMVRGTYQERPALPLTLGMEAAGVVDRIGPGVSGLRPGLRVMAFAASGALAEFGCFPAKSCTPIPDAMPFAHAAAFQVAFGTSHVALGHRANLRPGETLAVLGAAGGVGLAAVEIGRLMGARVIAVARGAERLEAARAAGADVLVDSAGADLREALRAEGGVDVVYDPVGGEAFTAALGALRPEGRLLSIGFASGTVPEIAANRLLVKNVSVIGFWWGGYMAFRPEVLAGSIGTLLGWYTAGKLRPHVGHTVPFEDVAEGFALLRDRAATGKVVVTMS